MFASKRRPFAITLLISVVVALALVTATNADSQRRDHLSLKRIVKQRSPQLPNLPVGGKADDPDPDGKESGSASAPAAPSASPSTPPASNSAQQSPSAAPSQNSPPPNSDSASPPSASQEPSTPADTPSDKPEPTPAPQAETPTENEGQGEQVVPGKQRSTVIRTSTEQPSQTADSEASQSGGASSAGKTTLTVFIAILASVAGVTIIWTLFRRWKLSRSSQFDARMNPIDWQPSADDTRRQSSASSFHSSGHGHSSVHGYGATDPTGLPHHDFTPGPTHLAPVGGYADLSRGPSPQPQMQESFSHAPSVNAPYGAQPGYGAQEYYGTGRQY